jgi:hypothetical protein
MTSLYVRERASNRLIQLLAVTIFFSILGMAASGRALAVGAVSSVTNVYHDVSPPLRTMPTAGRFGAAGVRYRQAEPVRKIPLPKSMKAANAPDLVFQASMVASQPLAVVQGQNFAGLGLGTIPSPALDVDPPDTNGAVGDTQYVQWANDAYGVFDKATGRIIGGPTPGNELWLGYNGPPEYKACKTHNDGDGIVLYDRLAKRWIITQFAIGQDDDPPTSDLQCVLVSTSADATGTYNRYIYAYDGVALNDYPKMAVWPDAYYITFNMYGKTDLKGADACAYDRKAMIQGLPSATMVCFQQDETIAGLLPSDLDGTRLPPAGSPNYMIDIGEYNSLHLWKFHVDFAGDNSTFTGPTIITVSPFTALCFDNTCVPQLYTSQTLEPLSDRLMYRLAYRNFGTHESLVVNHSVFVGNTGGIRWYEIQNPAGAPKVVQQGTFAPDGSFRWMGSIAMDRAGDMALGYSESSASMYPSIAVTGRVPGDPAGTMEKEAIVVPGAGSQSNDNDWNMRWGDYSAMQVDPTDDCTFWYTQEYYPNTSDYMWGTRIISFKFPNC